MATFDVFVEGTAKASPGEVQKLAEAMSKRYGLPQTELASRLAKGRFRVKGNLDEATANTYARDLEKIGARVTIVESRATQGQQRISGISLPPVNVSPHVVQRTGTTLPPQPRDEPLDLELGPPNRTGVPVARESGSMRAVVRETGPVPTVDSDQPAAAAGSVGRSTPRGFAARESGPLRSPSIPPSGSVPARPSASALPPRDASRPATAPASASALPPRDPSRPATAPASASALPPRDPSRPATAPASASASALPPRDVSRPATAPASGLSPAQSQTRPTPPSGLAAAFGSTGDIPLENLGALDEGGLSLAPLDGTEEPAPPSITFSEPNPELPAPTPTVRAKAKPRDVPLDLFTPPDAGPGEMQLELAVDDAKPKAPEKPVAPPPAAPVIAATTSARSTPTLQRKTATPASPMQGVVVETAPRWHFAGGVAIAFVLGLMASQLFIGARDSAESDIDDQVAQVQDASDRPDAPVPYAKLDEFRTARQSAKQAAHDRTTLLSFGVWVVVAGAAAAGWFLLVPARRR